MDTASIVKALKEERDRITGAIAALERSAPSSGRGIRAANGRRKRRKLTAAARKKISKAAKARWARAKRAGRNAL